MLPVTLLSHFFVFLVTLELSGQLPHQTGEVGVCKIEGSHVTLKDRTEAENLLSALSESKGWGMNSKIRGLGTCTL